jgi:hypothetical protein
VFKSLSGFYMSAGYRDSAQGLACVCGAVLFFVGARKTAYQNDQHKECLGKQSPTYQAILDDNVLVPFLFHYSYHTYGNISLVSTRRFTKPPPNSSLPKHPFPRLSCSKATPTFVPERSHGCPVATFVYRGSDLACYSYAT